MSRGARRDTAGIRERGCGRRALWGYTIGLLLPETTWMISKMMPITKSTHAIWVAMPAGRPPYGGDVRFSIAIPQLDSDGFDSDSFRAGLRAYLARAEELGGAHGPYALQAAMQVIQGFEDFHGGMSRLLTRGPAISLRLPAVQRQHTARHVAELFGYAFGLAFGILSGFVNGCFFSRIIPAVFEPIGNFAWRLRRRASSFRSSLVRPRELPRSLASIS